MEYNEEKISKYIERKKILMSLLKFIFLLIVLILFFISTMFINFNEIEQKESNIFKTYFFIIVSGSMQPNLNLDDIVIVRDCGFEKLKENDIITFIESGQTITHRIIDIDIKNKVLYTKGDNNNNIDWEEVHENQIYGKVTYKIPKVGKLVLFLHNNNGYIKVIAIIILIYFVIELRTRTKHTRKLKRKKYEIKKIRDNYNKEMVD